MSKTARMCLAQAGFGLGRKLTRRLLLFNSVSCKYWREGKKRRWQSDREQAEIEKAPGPGWSRGAEIGRSDARQVQGSEGEGPKKEGWRKGGHEGKETVEKR